MTARVDLEELERALVEVLRADIVNAAANRQRREGAEYAEAKRAKSNEAIATVHAAIAELRDLRGRMERAPVEMVVPAEGTRKPFGVALTMDAGLIGKRVRLVVCDAAD